MGEALRSLGCGNLGVYWRLLAAQVRGQAQYRASFLVNLTGSLAAGGVDLLEVVVLFRVARRLGGFDFATGFLMATLAAFGFALADFAVGSIDQIQGHVRSGRLDTVLIRPLGSLAQILCMDFAPRRGGRIAATGTLLAIAATRAEMPWTAANAILIVVTPLSGAVLFASVFVATATVSFWWVDSREFANSVTYGGATFTSYPMTVFDRAIRGLFGYGLGYAFVGYYPALTLLDRPDPLGLPGWVGWCSPPVSVIAVVVAGLVWRIGIRHYRSTGS